MKLYVGAQALALPHKTILAHDYPAGYELLLTTLDAEYGVHPQEQITVSLDTFSNYRHRGQPLATYLTTWRMYDGEAAELANLHISDVGKTYLL